MKTILLTVAYDGSDFSGWQIQPGARTVQGVLEEALSKACCRHVAVEGTSRTDAGVHALGQCVTIRGEFGIPLEKMKMVVNRLLPGDVMIRKLQVVPTNFHARFNAIGKTYRYRIRNCAEKDVFLRNFFYTVEKPLDIDAMKEGAARLVGTHDFKAFMAMGSTPQQSTVRTIYNCQAVAEEDPFGVSIYVKGNGFLYNMVRIIAGTLISVGHGKLKPEEIDWILERGERKYAGPTAPPQGLYLMKVFFESEALMDLKQWE